MDLQATYTIVCSCFERVPMILGKAIMGFLMFRVKEGVAGHMEKLQRIGMQLQEVHHIDKIDFLSFTGVSKDMDRQDLWSG